MVKMKLSLLIVAISFVGAGKSLTFPNSLDIHNYLKWNLIQMNKIQTALAAKKYHLSENKVSV